MFKAAAHKSGTAGQVAFAPVVASRQEQQRNAPLGEQTFRLGEYSPKDTSRFAEYIVYAAVAAYAIVVLVSILVK